MARKVDVARVQEELVAAVKQGDEATARMLVFQLGTGLRQVRAVLEAMLEEPAGLVRQAAVFGLGELGGTASVRCLEQQLALEEARGDYDGSAVMEDITRALGRIEDASARASLMRRLERLVAGKPERSDINDLALALWKRRHPDLIAGVRGSLEKLSLSEPHGLHGLLVLLEKSPEELEAWARNPSVSPEYKTRVLVVLGEELPDTLMPILPAFISTAQELLAPATRQDGEAAYYCERLLSLILLQREQLLHTFTQETRSLLRGVARSLVAARLPNCSTRAAGLLKFVGQPEDADLIMAHRPSEPALAKVFDEAAQALRKPRKN
ncbi:hypothetical protein NR798_41315 [Archangium gephyra]|uniref:hypothetical protein n=1 Tax=Archangium gephyra TaxID=48 RepID=UPI0035D42041